MKIQQLQQIIQGLQTKTKCPKCQNLFGSQDAEINKLQGSFVQFSSQCEHCHSKLMITAELNKRPLNIVEKGQKSSKIGSSKLDVFGLKESLKNFSALDLKTLENES